VTLAGAHGLDIVRSFCFMDKVDRYDIWSFDNVLIFLQYKMVLTAGEDGQIIAFQAE
jgi:hypothetical protein